MSDRIRIAFVIQGLDARTGGTEGQLLTLLERMDRRRFDPVLFCLQSTPWLENRQHEIDVRVLRWVLGPRISTVHGLVEFANLLRRERFKIVQTHFRDGNIAGVLAGALARDVTIVSTRRGEPYWTSTPGLLFLRWLDRHVDCFIANSRTTRDRYVREEHLNSSRVHVIYNGVDLERFVSVDRETCSARRRALGLQEARYVVGIVANLRSVKGHADLLHAFARVDQEHPGGRVVFVGEGELELPLRALASELGIASNLVFLGAREDVPEILGAFDVGVLASHFESFSNSILEYLAAGLPVVVTDVGGAREVVREGVDGFIVPPRDPDAMARALLRLLEHPGGPRAWRPDPTLDERFSTSRMVQAHEDLYERLARGQHDRSMTRARRLRPA
jgi:L-malate glycosyltransferase